MEENIYYNTPHIDREVLEGNHRAIVGGRWNEIGLLQFEFMKKQGLQPAHQLIDIGCGSLRGGVHFIDYLEPNGYYGLDINQSLLEAGWVRELVPKNLHHKIKKTHLVASDDFQFDTFQTNFDYALSVSLFTHLTFNSIRRCLFKLKPCLKEGAPYFTTFFLVEEGRSPDEPQAQHDGVTSYRDQDPYHYTRHDLQRLAEDSGLSLHIIGDWNHPRNQKMVCFSRGQ